jgi:hypothetical protein
VLVAVILLVLVAAPAFWTTVFAVASFTGCFLECTTPEPWVGVLWVGVTAVLIAVPVLAGVYAAGVRGMWLRVSLVIFGGLLLLLIGPGAMAVL